MSMQGGDGMELGKQIKMHRQEAELSQEELANRVYVSRQTILNWENDKSYPDVNSLVLLSEIFQISLDKLIKGDIGVMKEVIQKEEIEIEDVAKYRKQVIRHELIHAFLCESGLHENCEWHNEEMVDWLAMQAPKLQKIFKETEYI